MEVTFWDVVEQVGPFIVFLAVIITCIWIYIKNME